MEHCRATIDGNECGDVGVADVKAVVHTVSISEDERVGPVRITQWEEHFRSVGLLIQHHRVALRTHNTHRERSDIGHRGAQCIVERHLALHRIVDGTVFARAGPYTNYNKEDAQQAEDVSWTTHQNSFSIL